MTVQELIEELKKLPPDTKVCVWDPFHDRKTDLVRIDVLDGEVLIVS